MPLQRGQVWCGFAERGTQPLSGHLEQAEARDLADLDARPVHADRIAQAVLDLALVALRAHVNEVDHDEAAEVPEAQLPGDFVGCFQVGRVGGGLDVATLGGPRRVDVDGHQRLGVIDDDAAARRQFDRVGERRLDLALDLVAREERHRVVVPVELAQVLRHRPFDELAGFLVGLVVVDQDLADVVGEVVAQRAQDGRAVLEDQEGRRAADDAFLIASQIPSR